MSNRTIEVMEQYRNGEISAESYILQYADITYKLARNNGFKNVNVKFIQQYSFSNFLMWLKYKEPKGNPNLQIATEAMDAIVRKSADYIVAYLEK